MSEERRIERLEVEEALQNELENIQSAVIDSYTDIVTAALEDVLSNAGLGDARISEVSVEPPDYIIPTQNSRCFLLYIPRVGHVTACVPI